MSSVQGEPEPTGVLEPPVPVSVTSVQPCGEFHQDRDTDRCICGFGEAAHRSVVDVVESL